MDHGAQGDTKRFSLPSAVFTQPRPQGFSLKKMGPLTFLGKSPRDEVGFYMDRGEWFRVGGGANPDL